MATMCAHLAPVHRHVHDLLVQDLAARHGHAGRSQRLNAPLHRLLDLHQHANRLTEPEPYPHSKICGSEQFDLDTHPQSVHHSRHNTIGRV